MTIVTCTNNLSGCSNKKRGERWESSFFPSGKRPVSNASDLPEPKPPLTFDEPFTDSNDEAQGATSCLDIDADYGPGELTSRS